MSKQQELIKSNLEAAEKGALHRDTINKTIKADFQRLLCNYEKRMDLYLALSKRYGKCVSTIHMIVNN